MNSELMKWKFEEYLKKSTNLDGENNTMLELQILKILLLIKCSDKLFTAKKPVCLEQPKIILLCSNNCPDIQIRYFY